MKLWILEPKKGLSGNSNPWEPWYDKAFGFIVRAETEQEAREIAEENAGDESWSGRKTWMKPELSTCIELSEDGEKGLVLRDFASA